MVGIGACHLVDIDGLFQAVAPFIRVSSQPLRYRKHPQTEPHSSQPLPKLHHTLKRKRGFAFCEASLNPSIQYIENPEPRPQARGSRRINVTMIKGEDLSASSMPPAVLPSRSMRMQDSRSLCDVLYSLLCSLLPTIPINS